MTRVASPATADLGWLEPGTHLCAFPRDERQTTRIAATFVDQGLSAGDQLLYVASGEQADALLAMLPVHVRARDALASGQLQVTSFAEAYGTERPTDLGAIADGFRAAAEDSRKQGFPALRVAARMDDLAGLLGSQEAVVEWERMSTGLQHEIGVSSVCLYSRGGLDDGQAARIADEHAGLAPELAETPLASFLAVDEPWGMRVSGEVDISNGELLQRLLLSRAAVVPRLHLDLEGLTFADVGTLARLRSVAVGLPETGSLTLESVPGFVRRTLDICGLGHERLVVAP
ncbi:MAG TPA: MEDS domain-containing protein [Nocardioides sp.]